MKLVKADHPRRIDHVIDYFGEPNRGAASGPRGHEGAAPRPFERGR